MRYGADTAAAASLVLSAIFVGGALAQGAQCRIVDQQTFPGDGEKVRLARPVESGPSANIAIFRAPLAVNTDGAPNSYHPMDPLGQTLAINRFDNGIAISATNGATLTTRSSSRCLGLGAITTGKFPLDSRSRGRML